MRAFTPVVDEIRTSLEWIPVSGSRPGGEKSEFMYLSMRPSLYTLKKPGKSWVISEESVAIFLCRLKKERCEYEGWKAMGYKQ